MLTKPNLLLFESLDVVIQIFIFSIDIRLNMIKLERKEKASRELQNILYNQPVVIIFTSINSNFYLFW